ncbi:MAG TPA: cell division protein FtsB [Zoogloea sp.]|uniref:cell division protein FtsB n=1 Tax=Zoogloea sp. TaxID=49181 RepID=UPI002C4208A0|nr:cell division protein FtsB [Zoogloea sp.]HMV17469.1 cell division protein FtsB [Rhodocyclaceae bacterium]HMV64219.1 cell division protein FtsB [Rhodocyclaceae bacterium]HMW52836.1 cell division protein FtsB [Rhodocyclaceae bacterium]HMZ75970.1 cell division protein FtsB [Rhodocyclaceae bacterium]HNA67598.1 cell division protein FtsB [Rhodocyclaceae bacterium]
MRWPLLILVLLVAALQYPLWIGKGGWLRVWEVEQQLAEQKEGNRKLEQRNTGLEAEVRDLKSGYEAVEERARFELGLIKPDEVYVQVPQKTPQ